MYTVVRHYKNIKGDTLEITGKIYNGFVPLISKIQGFVDYYCFFSNENTLTSISLFKDRKGADDSVKAAVDFVAKELAQYFPEKPAIMSGEDFVHREGQRKTA